jgi:hypothetical protein
MPNIAERITILLQKQCPYRTFLEQKTIIQAIKCERRLSPQKNRQPINLPYIISRFHRYNEITQHLFLKLGLPLSPHNNTIV